MKPWIRCRQRVSEQMLSSSSKSSTDHQKSYRHRLLLIHLQSEAEEGRQSKG